MAKKDESLTLRVASLADDIDAEAFIFVLTNTLRALQEINKELSGHGTANVEWKIKNAGMQSPIFTTIHGVTRAGENGELGPKSIDAWVDGLGRLTKRAAPPPRFNEAALRHLSALQKAFPRGVSQIEYAVNGHSIVADRIIFEHAAVAIQKLELDRAKESGSTIEYGELVGYLQTVSALLDKDKITIRDDLTNKETPCYFRDVEIETRVREGWKHRVIVVGELTVDRITGDALQMQVDDMRILGERSELPQMEDLLGFDITGGMEPSEYVRGLRDGE